MRSDITPLSLALASCVVACSGEDPGAPPVGQSEASITSGMEIPTSWPSVDQGRGTVKLGGCTGMIVSKRHVVTAAHCQLSVGEQITFYYYSAPTYLYRYISRIEVKPGVNLSSGDYTDSNGDYADISVITFDEDIPWYAVVSELPDGYPGSGVWMSEVGSGLHDGQPNANRSLEIAWDRTYSNSSDSGEILMQNVRGDHGDSGGPLYKFNYDTTRFEVHGVHNGAVTEWTRRGRFTSIWRHIDWVMDRINYGSQWGWDTNWFINGTVLRFERLTKSRERCLLKCEKDGQCRAMSYRRSGSIGYCYLFSSVTSSTYWSGFTSVRLN